MMIPDGIVVAYIPDTEDESAGWVEVWLKDGIPVNKCEVGKWDGVRCWDYSKPPSGWYDLGLKPYECQNCSGVGWTWPEGTETEMRCSVHKSRMNFSDRFPEDHWDQHCFVSYLDHEIGNMPESCEQVRVAVTQLGEPTCCV